MTLTAVTGQRKAVNDYLLQKAFDKAPVLIIDCANCANPLAYVNKIPEEKFYNVYVIVAESIYRFRDAVKKIPFLSNQLGTDNIIITTYDRLFTYDNEQETQQVTDHAWEMLQELAKTKNIIVGTTDNPEAYTTNIEAV